MTTWSDIDSSGFVGLNQVTAQDGFDESISFVVECAYQDEVDRYWEALTRGGGEISCGLVEGSLQPALAFLPAEPVFSP